MITLDQVKIIREKKKDNPDQMNLFGNNSGKKKKYNQPSKDQSDAIQSKSALNKSKKYASGEYPKIGGGDRMTPKSKGPGASTGGTNTPPAIVGGKSKGTTPVKVNITKPVKQSEVSKKAKEFTTKINKANINRKEFTNKVDKMRRAAQRSIKKQFPGDKSGAYQRVKADIDTKNLIKKAGGTGDIGFTAPDRKTKVAKRTTRAVKQGTPDPFSTPTPKKPIRPFGDKPVTSSAPGFGKGMTPGQAKVKAMDKKAFKVTQPKDVTLPKSFTDFSKKIKKYRVDTDIDKKIKNPKLDISKVIKKRKSETPVQQTIPGTGGNRNIKKTFKKKTSRQKPPSGGSSSKYKQGSIFDKPSGSGGSGGSGGGGKKGGALGFPNPEDGEFKGKFEPPKKPRITGNYSDDIAKMNMKNKGRGYVNKMSGRNFGGRKVDTTAPGYTPRKIKGYKFFTNKKLDAGQRAQKILQGRAIKKNLPKGLKFTKPLVQNIARNPKAYGKAGLVVGGIAGTAAIIKSLQPKPGDLTSKDFAGKVIKNRKGKNVRFKYDTYNPTTKTSTSAKNLAGSVITNKELVKFKKGEYKLDGVDLNKRIQKSAFTKQLKDASKGTGFLGRQTDKDRKFLQKYKKAAERRNIKVPTTAK